MPLDELLQLLGLKEILLARAQGEISQLNTRVAQLEAALASRPSRRKKAE